MSERILTLDGWRGLAILFVLIGHFIDPPGMNFSTVGVELFFVLSGRLMADILFVKRLALPNFYYRRITRILPTLMVFAAAVWVAGEILGEPFAFSPAWVAAAVTFTINYVVVLTHPTGWLDHLWSLCVEEHAYLLLGLIAFLFGRSTGRPVTAMWLLGIAAMIDGVVSMTLMHMSYEATYWRSDVHIASIFVSGAVYLGLRHRMDQTRIGRWATPVFVLALIGGLFFSLSPMPPALTYTAGTLCFSIAVALCDALPKTLAAVLATPALTQLGVWSYSLYLWQQPFYRMYEALHPDWRLPMAVCAIASGLASFYFLERPARRWLNAMWGKWGTKTPAPAAAD